MFTKKWLKWYIRQPANIVGQLMFTVAGAVIVWMDPDLLPGGVLFIFIWPLFERLVTGRLLSYLPEDRQD